MAAENDNAKPAARFDIPDGTCLTFTCDGRVFEVCAKTPKPGIVVVDPGGITAAREIEGVVDLHALDVDWDDRDDVTTFRARG